jgi:hypothetical protein
METPVTINAQQAAQALKEVGAAERRSAEVYLYQRSAPYLLMWGAIWIAGHGGTDLWPRYAGWLWAALLLTAMVISTVIGRHGGATYAVMGPVNHLQQGAFPPLVVALAYVLTGLWSGPRFVLAGVAVAALTLGGFFYLPQHFLLWEGFVGGGALILAGLWFRRV